MRKLITKLLVLGAAGFLALAILVASIKLPDLNNFKERRVAQSTKIYDRTGQILLYDVHGEEKRTIVSFEEIPRSVKNATVALEDTSFYRHYGFRPLSFLRAVLINFLRGSFEQGGSTITQQLAKTTLLTPEKTIIRKAKEIIIAFKLERKYSKDEILNLYLNQIPYGNGAYGIEAATQTFFRKNAKDLTALEASYLVSLPKAPTYYSPYGKHRKELDARAEFALKKMLALGFLTEKEFKEAESQKIKFSPTRTQGIIAPHFVIEIREELNKKFGEDAVERGGFKVTTTLDVELQQKTEEIVSKYAETNEKNFNAKNAAVVALDPKTGNVLAMVGSRDYFDTAGEGNFNVATALRQPGSAFKPFVYATAFKKGLTPETVVFDFATEFNPLCTMDGKPTWTAESSPNFEEELKKCYHPQNFDEKFRGPVSLREALAQSLNVPSVKALYLAGITDSISTARDFGITSLNDPERFGLTLVLGGGEVSLLELTAAFGVFANEGIKSAWKHILKIEDAEGNAVYEAKEISEEVIDKNIARVLNDILSDNKARAPSFGEFSALYFPGKKVAAKTGTTNDFRDAWVIGYTPDVVIGAWAGNNDNEPMEKKVAGFIVAPWWHEIMDYALTRAPSSEFTPPEPFPQNKPFLRGEWRGGKEFIIDKISGKLATSHTPPDLQEKKVIQEVHTILYWLDPQSPQFKNWEEEVRKWAKVNGFLDQDESIVPQEYDNIHIPENFPKITKIDLTQQKQSYSKNATIIIKPQVTAKFNLAQVDFFYGDGEEFVGSVKKAPFEFALKLKILEGQGDSVQIKIKAYDGVGNSSEEKIYIKITP